MEEHSCSDTELAELALSAVGDDPFAADAVPFEAGTRQGVALLPEWYMPIPQMSAADRTPRRTLTVALLIIALVVLNGAGLCVTYGLPEIAW